MSTQNIPNLNVRSSEESYPKNINLDKRGSHVCSMDENESKIFIFNKYSSDGRKSKAVYKVSIQAK